MNTFIEDEADCHQDPVVKRQKLEPTPIWIVSIDRREFCVERGAADNQVYIFDSEQKAEEYCVYLRRWAICDWAIRMLPALPDREEKMQIFKKFGGMIYEVVDGYSTGAFTKDQLTASVKAAANGRINKLFDDADKEWFFNFGYKVEYIKKNINGKDDLFAIDKENDNNDDAKDDNDDNDDDVIEIKPRVLPPSLVNSNNPKSPPRFVHSPSKNGSSPRRYNPLNTTAVGSPSSPAKKKEHIPTWQPVYHKVTFIHNGKYRTETCIMTYDHGVKVYKPWQADLGTQNDLSGVAFKETDPNFVEAVECDKLTTELMMNNN